METNTQREYHKPVDYDPFCEGEILLTVASTEAQKEIWVSVQMGGDGANCAFNESVALKLSGRLDIETLRSSFQRVVQRHEALRATFTPDGETLCINASLTLEVPLVDLTGLDKQLRDERLSDILHQEVQLPFSLEHGPLIRGQIVKVNEREFFFIITAHHIICDGWSSAVLLKELGVTYSAIKQGVRADLEKPHQFSDYALLLDSQAQGSEYSADEDFWLRKFQGKIPVLDLPADRNRPPLRSYNSAREDRKLDRTMVVNLKNMGAKAGCSFFITLLAGFKVFLYRLSGQKDLVVGIPAAGQSVVGQDTLVGHCVNTLPIRSSINGDQNIGEYLTALRKEMFDAYDHQQFTFGSLLKKLSIERDSSRIPLVPVVINIDKGIDGKELGFEGLDVEYVSNPRQFENFEIFINAVDTGGDVVLECQYNTDLYNADTIRRLLEEFEVLLAAISTDTDVSIAKLPLLTEADRKQLLVEWNATEAEYPRDKCLHELFEAQVMRTPDAVAAVFQGEQISYRKLSQRANQLANYLIKSVAKPDTLIGIYVERSLDMLVGLLGILKAGAAYVPMDPSFPPDRLSYMMEDANISILVTQEHLQDVFPQSDRKTICIDNDWGIIEKENEDRPNCMIDPKNLAYTIYTSGSTGKPKGVMLEHSAVVNFLISMKNEPGLTQDDILLAVTTISFDIAVLELFLPLITGAKVVIASKDEAIDGNLLLKLIEQCKATVLQATPATWKLMIEAAWENTPNLKMLCGGEPLSRNLANMMLVRGGELWNMYGPTETTIWSSVEKIEPGNAPILIGPPIANTQFYVVDKEMEPVPIGVSGELLIGGDGLARGYLNRPNLTADRFIKNPFSNSDSRIYRTGDLARFRPNGVVEFLGRLDFQVKVRGFRIELGEIEHVLSQHKIVKEAVVVAREDDKQDVRLVAYIIPESKMDWKVSELRKFLSKKLPDYMIPSLFMKMGKFPLTSNGKIDRKSLPAPDGVRPDLENSFVPPRNPVEEKIAAIWTKILGLEQVGVHDNFFDLGGHSLLAVRLVAQIEKVFGKKLPLAALFPTSTIEKLADKLRQEEEPASWHSLVTLQPNGSHPPLFGIHSTRYHTLARYLGPEQPIYALRYGHASEISEDIMTLPEQLEDLASHYIEEMKAVQPEGPYFLIGLCIGALLAFEMAQQLVAKDEQVALLALADPIIQNGKIPLPLPTRASNLLQLGPVEILKRGQKRVNKKLRTLSSKTSNRAQDKYHSYEPKTVYPGKAIIIKTIGGVTLSSTFDPELGWGKLVSGGLKIHEVHSGHTELFEEPAVGVTAEIIKACLAQAQADVLARV